MLTWSFDIAFLPADKVFGPASITEAVYEEGVKNVALSALMGINGTVFDFMFILLQRLCFSALCNDSMLILLQQLFLLMDKLAVERHIQ